MSRKLKNNLVRIIVGAVVFIIAIVITGEPGTTSGYISFALFLVSYFIVGYDILWGALKNIFHGQIFDENFLMTIATIGAFVLGEYPEGVAVMLFFQIGEWFQGYAVGKSRRSISSLMDIRPDYANLLDENNKPRTVDPETIKINDNILIKPGERIPLDGIVLNGFSSLDTASLTGESLPREVKEGDEVISGCININGTLTVKVTKEFGESTVSKVLDLVENQSGKKAKSEKFISRFAKYYTPAVCFAALFLAIAVPLISGQEFSKWVYRALTFLVISCPCALVISIPLSFFGGIGGASKSGILIKGANYLEALSTLDTVVFDKTGTLTKGRFEVTEISPVNISKNDLLETASYAEIYSNHPVALSIKSKYGKELNNSKISEVTEEPGMGVKTVFNNKTVLAGNNKLMAANNVSGVIPNVSGTVIYLAIDGEFAGYILAEDTIKEDAKSGIKELKEAGVSKTFMLTGDSTDTGERVAKKLGIDKAYTKLLPTDKVSIFENILNENKKDTKSKSTVAFVGDGINDAPVLARADVGIAMGGLGSDAAIEAADVVIMDDNIIKIAKAVKISRKTLKIVQQNIVFAIGVKVLVLFLSAFGKTSMWAAIFADVGVSLIAILNSMRALKTDSK